MAEAQEQRLALGLGQEEDDIRPKHWPYHEKSILATAGVKVTKQQQQQQQQQDRGGGGLRENLANRLVNDDEHTPSKKRQDEFGTLSAENYNPVSVQMVLQVLPYGPSSRRVV